MEKNCRIIGVNLDGSRYMNPNTCPKIIQDVGAIFVPFSPQIIAYALKNYQKKDSGAWYYKDSVYQELGY